MSEEEQREMLRSVLNKTRNDSEFSRLLNQNRLTFFDICVVEPEYQVLIYFPVDDSLAVVKKTAILPTIDPLVKGMSCRVKEGIKIHEGKIVENR